MQTSKTDKFVYYFVYFLLFSMAIKVDGLIPDFVLGAFEEVQPGYVIRYHMNYGLTDIFVLPSLWAQILSNFVIPQIPKMLTKDRKVVAIGLTRLLTQSEIMLRDPSVQHWSARLIYS